MATEKPSTTLLVSDLPPAVDEATIRKVFGPYGAIKSCQHQPPNKALITFASQDEATWIHDNLDGNIPEGFTSPVGVTYSAPKTTIGFNKGGAKGAATPAMGGGCGGYGGGGGGQAWGKGGAMGGAGPYGCGGKGCGGGQMSMESIQVLKQGLSYGGALPGGKWNNDKNALYVGGLPEDTCDIDLYEIFSTFGAIPYQGVRAMQNEEGKCKGFGFVNFQTPEACQLAIQNLNGTMMPTGRPLKVQLMQPKTGKGGGKAAAE